MTLLLLAQHALDLGLDLVLASDEAPEAEDVKAGWTAFVVFLLLIGAVVLLGFSLVKHLRRAQAAEEAGLYGSDAAVKDTEDQEPRQS
ncbi:hypothetical protein [Nocardioides dilutus]